MFEGNGFGVGLTINQLRVPVDAPPAPDDWGHPTRLGELMPVATRDDVGLGEEMRRANIADSRLWAYRVEMIAQLAARRRADRDRGPEESGAAAPGWVRTSWVLADCSEFLADEVALIMNCSRAEATRLAEAALILLPDMFDTWAALADGELNWPRARAIAAEIARHGPGLDPQVRATVEAVVLPQAAELPVARLRALVRAELLKRDPDGADRRRRQAQAAADVSLRRSNHEGMAEVVTLVPQPEAAAIVGTVDGHARQAKADGDERPIGVLRAEVMTQLILRPGAADGPPPVTAELHVLAPLGALLPDPADPTVLGPPAGIGAVDDQPVTAAHLLGAGGALLATLTRAELERAARRPPTPTGPPTGSDDGGGPGTGTAAIPAVATRWA